MYLSYFRDFLNNIIPNSPILEILGKMYHTKKLRPFLKMITSTLVTRVLLVPCTYLLVLESTIKYCISEYFVISVYILLHKRIVILVRPLASLFP